MMAPAFEASSTGGRNTVNSQLWGPFRDNQAVVHRSTARAKLVIDESDSNRGFDPQTCATSKPLIFQAKIEFSTVHDGHYQLPPGLKKRKT
jgi:hypothetical protein